MPAGRPKKPIDLELLERLAHINCSYEECAAMLKVDATTLQKKYSDVFKRGREKGRMSLKRQMWRKAIDQDNTTMQIFLSKNLLGYSDRMENKLGLVDDQIDTVAQLVGWLKGIDQIK